MTRKQQALSMLRQIIREEINLYRSKNYLNEAKAIPMGAKVKNLSKTADSHSSILEGVQGIPDLNFTDTVDRFIQNVKDKSADAGDLVFFMMGSAIDNEEDPDEFEVEEIIADLKSRGFWKMNIEDFKKAWKRQVGVSLDW